MTCIFFVCVCVCVWYQVVAKKGIEVNYKRKMIEVLPDKKEAVFEVLEEDRTETYPVSY